MAEPATELSLDPAAVLAAEEHEVAIVGRSPWYLAWRRLRRNYVALFSLFVFVVIVTGCFLAPVYASQVAHTGPNETHSAETVIVSGKPTQVISGGATYDAKTGEFTVRAVKILGPTWWHAAREVRPRRRQPRPRRGRAAALRGPQLAEDRHWLRIHLHLFRGPVRAHRRLFRRLGRLDHHAFLRPDLGLPGAAARDRARQRAVDQRLPPLRHQHRRPEASGSRRW